ncbi:MAG TPA: pullulanase-type alpha-1,6-glucosidase [Oligoflexus sp.]|uniref:pullulanase-type alpha-1,6-glucosidase n=1 Tax=Oligoflexus sp. TaxID=1971216 RepID=UPI002D50515E|nr:pullulanase-type alpha-1,6-glucosidase [Oligoflexus sp.]HYX36501.1 pullulanase-type alpha-1,6-glucosidase [Oligoflexus sp.]
MRCFLSILLLLGFWLPMACDQQSDDNGNGTEPEAFVIHLRIPPTEQNLEFSLTQGSLTALPDDAFGRKFAVTGAAENTALVVTRAGEEVERLAFPVEGPGVWFFAGSPTAFTTAPPLLPQNDKDLVVYFVPGADQATQSWGLHIWDATTNTSFTKWEAPLSMDAPVPAYGYAARLDVPAQTGYSAAPTGYESLPQKMGLIVHSGDLKATEGDLYYEPARHGRIIFLNGGKIYCSPDLRPCGWQPEIEGASAHWVKRDEMLWQVNSQAARYVLLSSASGQLDLNNLKNVLNDPAVVQVPLTKNTSISPETRSRFPHLNQGFLSLSVDAESQLASLVKSELVMVALNEASRIIAATRPQLGGVLDDGFAFDGKLGLVLGDSNQLKLWAPTAQGVSLNLYGRDKKLKQTVAMTEDRGVWSVDIPSTWVKERLYYRFAMKVYHPFSGRIESYEVTDPYANSGSYNGELSQLLDLDDPALKPAGWDAMKLAPLQNSTDMVFYEMHIRDFSARDPSVPLELRGTYDAFTRNGLEGRPISNGMRHLKKLQAAGLTHVQVLPAYDFGSVNEDRSQTVNLNDPMSKLCAILPAGEALCQDPGIATIFDVMDSLPRDGQHIAQLNSALIERDSFNWGYDPVHYGMPDGSYVAAAGGEGEARVLQFRNMAQSLAEIGIHLAMDVVYNHTYASGMNPNSILDKVVPGYYHRLHPITGAVERSSCCENTASERVMMEKLMIDTLQRWHQDYKVDAFRFDLMGLHLKENMLNVQKALGPNVFIFGEGWAMGELNSDIRNQSSARQANMAGTGIGSFNDRLRDAVRGGGPMDCGVLLTQQSPVNGLFFDDNGRGGLLKERVPGASCTDPSAFVDAALDVKKQNLLGLQDRLRLGLAGTLRDYPLVTSSGTKISGHQLDYFGQGAGYTQAPGETINYIENHDNQTFWDISQVKLPYDVTMAERVRVHGLGLAFNMLAMGVPYFEMGAEFLRSKSLVRDSYNAGDWYNQVDFTWERSIWNRGLPAADKDGNNLAVIRDVVKNVPEGPGIADTQKAIGMFLDLLAIRKDSPLFRLTKAADVEQRVDFIGGTEAVPGVIALRIHDEVCGATDLDPRYSEIVVLFNLQPMDLTLPYRKKMKLHPLQLAGSDDVVKQAQSDGLQLKVPARTAAVFVAPPTAGVPLCRPESLRLPNR